MAAYTPGPWFAVNRGTKKEPMMSVMAARIAGQKPGHEVAMCATGDSSQEMENANAALIAKAPDLFEVLKQIVHEYSNTYDADCEGGYWKGAASIDVEVMERAKRLVGGAL